MKLIEDLIIIDKNGINMIPKGSILEAINVEPEINLDSGKSNRLSPQITKPKKLTDKDIRLAIDDLRLVAHKVKNLDDASIKNAGNTIVNAFARLLHNGDLMALKGFIKGVADKIKQYTGDKENPKYTGIRIVWPALAKIVDNFNDMMPECKEFGDMISECKKLMVENKIDWKTGQTAPVLKYPLGSYLYGSEPNEQRIIERQAKNDLDVALNSVDPNEKWAADTNTDSDGTYLCAVRIDLLRPGVHPEDPVVRATSWDEIYATN